ncbi:two component transcriptional regulator, LuxR family [Marinobacter sp. es.042]|uniref:response regulator transcription factor n=1 Tax=Marinobacter sp. es.042 TaxID=1761794 RepID=UPI000B50D6F0|nr:response regulator transcription factor [Marinobacter sp. es.042]SNB59075.1 two component transcriptional regulator, LuxR family [Marinobacter sp. es.042]
MDAITSKAGQAHAAGARPVPIKKVLLVDDHALFSQGLAGLIRQEGLAESVVIASTVEGASDLLVRQDDFQLILLDIALQGETGLALLPRLASHREPPPVVIISSSEDEATVRAAQAAGASGFLAKSAGRSALVSMVRSVSRGESYFPGGVDPVAPGLSLTPRQMDVLLLLAQGFPNKRICQSLKLTEHTVKTHLKAIFTQLGVHNRTECVNLARARGWL